VIEMAREIELTIRLPDALRQRLDREASASARSLDSVVIDFIADIVAERDEGLPPLVFLSADTVLCKSAQTEGLLIENPNDL
jgi:hypothetical protein